LNFSATIDYMMLSIGQPIQVASATEY